MQNKTTLPLTAESLSFQRDNPIYVFGHRNPDSDAICSALVVADWLNYTGRPATPWRLGISPRKPVISSTLRVFHNPIYSPSI
jgi:manganese-dependent inorganic pyrophosphatase